MSSTFIIVDFYIVVWICANLDLDIMRELGSNSFGKFHEFKNLNFRNTKVNSLIPLLALKSLGTLDFTNTQVKDFDPLGELPNLYDILPSPD